MLQKEFRVTADEVAEWQATEVMAGSMERIKKALRSLPYAGTDDVERGAAMIATIARRLHARRAHLTARDELLFIEDIYTSLVVIIEDAVNQHRSQRSGREFLHTLNIARHLKHPRNLATLEVIGEWGGSDSPALKQLAAELIDQVTHMAEARPGTLLENRIVEHSVHLLGRLGDKEIPERLRFLSKLGDPYIDRACLLVSSVDARQFDAERVITEILNDSAVGRALVEFERVHFGDAAIEADGSYRLASKRGMATVSMLATEVLSRQYAKRDPIRKAQLFRLLSEGYGHEELSAGARMLLRSLLEVMSGDIDDCRVNRLLAHSIENYVLRS
jgi:hypothetical protein